MSNPVEYRERGLDMTVPKVEYSNALVKQCVADWGDEFGFSADEQIQMHLEEVYGITTILVLEAVPEADYLILKIMADQWPEPREFALLSSGSFAW